MMFFLVFICGVFLEVVITEVLYFIGVVVVVYDDTSFSFISFGYHCIFFI
jgi:hypothetical protein